MTSSDEPGLAPADSDLLRQVVQLALDNAGVGRAPFGALVVRDGQVLGTGVNTTAQDNDPTAHAEVAAIRAACSRHGLENLTGATVVSSCEPCVMCHAACAVAGLARIIYAAPKEFVPGVERTPPILTQMQDALHRLAPGQLQYVPTPGADEPFARWQQ
ncbi:nucleoside deaminase [Actinopolymorpha sp. B11F2]|uniref:nucleoside deaminase n=1 Tax=Actinopolymorpha sp. B11F2 TaxID=3160862 RepID=UPI0032E40089